MTLYNQLVGVELSSYDLDLSDERDVTSVAIFQEDLNHFKDYRYPRALEVLGVNFKSKSWGMLALSAPEYIERRRLHFYPSVIDDKDFWDNWGFNIGKIQRLGRRSMDAVLNYRSLLNPQKRGNLHLYGYVNKNTLTNSYVQCGFTQLFIESTSLVLMMRNVLLLS